MNSEKYLDDLLVKLTEDSSVVNKNFEDKKRLWREIVASMDKEVNEEVLFSEDKYLRSELLNRKLTDGEKISTIDSLGSEIKHNKKIALWNGDLTSLYVDAVVNEGNTMMNGSFAVDNSLDNMVFTYSGMRLRCKARQIIKENLELGNVMITRAYNLPCDYVIHAACYGDQDVSDIRDLIKKTYFNVLECARENMLKTIAFSTMFYYRYDISLEEVAQIVVDVVNDYLRDHSSLFNEIIICVNSEEELEVYKNYLI